MAAHSLHIHLPQEADTADFADRLAPLLRTGDTLLLSGPIGAGKSAFARALIRARLNRVEDVPSPTFTLVQTYEHPDGDIWHCDLYRLTHPDEVFELGLDDAFEDAICLIEWPDRLARQIPENALRLAFQAGQAGHDLTLDMTPHWAARLGALDV